MLSGTSMTLVITLHFLHKLHQHMVRSGTSTSGARGRPLAARSMPCRRDVHAFGSLTCIASTTQNSGSSLEHSHDCIGGRPRRELRRATQECQPLLAAECMRTQKLPTFTRPRRSRSAPLPDRVRPMPTPAGAGARTTVCALTPPPLLPAAAGAGAGCPERRVTAVETSPPASVSISVAGPAGNPMATKAATSASIPAATGWPLGGRAKLVAATVDATAGAPGVRLFSEPPACC